MKRARQFFILGIAGLGISLAIYLLALSVGKSYDLTPHVIPWIAFLIIGLSIRLKYVKK